MIGKFQTSKSEFYSEILKFYALIDLTNWDWQLQWTSLFKKKIANKKLLNEHK